MNRTITISQWVDRYYVSTKVTTSHSKIVEDFCNWRYGNLDRYEIELENLYADPRFDRKRLVSDIELVPTIVHWIGKTCEQVIERVGDDPERLALEYCQWKYPTVTAELLALELSNLTANPAYFQPKLGVIRRATGHWRIPRTVIEWATEFCDSVAEGDITGHIASYFLQWSEQDDTEKNRLGIV